MLSVLAVLHLAGVRLLPLLLFKDASIVDLTIVTSSINRSRYVYLPAYMLLATAGLYHSMYGINLALQILRLKNLKLESKTWLRIFNLSAAVAVMTVLAISGLGENVPISHPIEFDQVHNSIVL